MKVKVTTFSGDEDIIEVDKFDPIELEKKRNNPEITSILIGDHSYARIDIRTIKPVD